MKASIIIPYRTDRGYLSEAIDSAKRQELMTLGHDYEVIVQQGDDILSVNINKALERAQGKFIKILAEDDKLDPFCLHNLYNFAEDNNLDLVCADAINFSQHGQSEVHQSVLPKTVSDMAYENLIHGGTCLYRRAKMPLYDEKMWTAEEYDIHFRMALAGCKFGYVPKVVYYYRIHDQQKSSHYWTSDPITGDLRREFVQNLQFKYMWNATKINQ
jgi:glycosyltransferase involved in cell wall biosynthesis